MPRRIRKLHIIILVAIGLLVGLTAWRFYPSRAPTQILPTPNGYDDFLKAGSTIRGPLDDAPKLEQSALAALVSTNAESLRLARLGLTRACVVPFNPTLPPSDLINTKNLALL